MSNSLSSPRADSHQSDLIPQQDNNQSIPATVLRQQQPQPLSSRQIPLNDWPNYQANWVDFGNHQPQHRANKANTAFSNGGKIIRQSQQGDNFAATEDGFAKPSLDDKIRHLLIGKDGEVGDSNQSNDNNNVIYHQSIDNKAATNLSQAWNAKRLSFPTESLNNGSLVLKREAGGQNASVISDSSSRAANGNGAQKHLASSSPSSELTNRIYVNDSGPINMGNRQQHQYHVNSGKQQADSPTDGFRIQALHRKNDASSQLIVDLTTPRVLAKTQTTLLSSSSQQQMSNSTRKDSWSINQVGLPQLSSLNQQHTDKSISLAKQLRPTLPGSSSNMQSITSLDINKSTGFSKKPNSTLR